MGVRVWLETGAGVAALFGLAMGMGALWYRYGPCDYVEEFVVVGDRVVVREMLIGQAVDVSGADRLMLREAATGRLIRQVRADGRQLLAHVGGSVWLRNGVGLEARDAETLAVVRSWEDLVAAHEPMRALEVMGRVSYWDNGRRALLFTGSDGRRLQFSVATETLEPEQRAESPSSSPWVDAIPWPGGGEVRLRDEPGSERDVVVGPSGEATAISGLSVRLLHLPVDDGTVWALLLRELAQGAPAHLVRVDPVAGRELWSLALPGSRGTAFERVARVGEVILLGDGTRMYGVDADSGDLRWSRAPWDLGGL
jgi:hypothetical protein